VGGNLTTWRKSLGDHMTNCISEHAYINTNDFVMYYFKMLKITERKTTMAV